MSDYCKRHFIFSQDSHKILLPVCPQCGETGTYDEMGNPSPGMLKRGFGWTVKKPTVSGYYWVYYRGSIFLANVIESQEEMRAFIPILGDVNVDSFFYWWGPIIAPLPPIVYGVGEHWCRV